MYTFKQALQSIYIPGSQTNPIDYYRYANQNQNPIFFAGLRTNPNKSQVLAPYCTYKENKDKQSNTIIRANSK